MKKITLEEFIATLKILFSIEDELTEHTDLSLYIRDSIDLGEVIAVLKEDYGVTPQDSTLFKVHTRLGDIVKIFNHEL